MSPQRIPLSNERAVATEPAWSSLGWALCCARQIAVSPSRKQAADAPANLLEPGSILHGSLDEFSHWAAPHVSAGITSRAGLVGPTIGTKRPVVELRRPPKGGAALRPSPEPAQRRAAGHSSPMTGRRSSARAHAFTALSPTSGRRRRNAKSGVPLRKLCGAGPTLGAHSGGAGRLPSVPIKSHTEATYVCYFCRNRVRLVDTQRGTDTSDAGQRQRDRI